MASLSLRGALAVTFLVCQMTLPFNTLPLQAEEIPAGTVSKSSIAVSEGPEGVEGIASYYATYYNGRRTNSGARYNPEKMTAAHPSLPHGTKVKVVNIVNKKEVIVTINDRCKKKKKPFIDLSRAAARQLGFLGKGIAKVRIIPLAGESS
ncbi:septal ring lytic transglycosylase RlpA family protein [Geobacter sp. DSM 9736]|uniref:septal ring lytic transglycosylase RlpA family protein n=1 Tax=Geobacter sp. DSM 9736 TaxID=1277350 RepID=UPI000B50DCD8|nr:septal ring lytic transglycosylase RlpA family protein [Geobacter sp. DSM 9736]SNB47426.1 rare lipoprotein A [Geobacter sp. DSM 9736]